jgi:prepilin peptidase CpaA
MAYQGGRVDYNIVLFVIISMLLLYACYTDIVERRISNTITLSVMVLSLIAAFLNEGAISLTVAGCILIVGFFLSSAGVIGAGDIKLASALALGLPSQAGLDFLLLSGFVGVPVSLVAWLYYRIRGRGGNASVPYGIAIAGGYFLLFVFR